MRANAASYARRKLNSVPHIDCGLKVGDVVTWVNDYGAVWEHAIIGFEKPEHITYGGFVCFDSDAYWFPHKLSCIKKVNGIAFKLVCS